MSETATGVVFVASLVLVLVLAYRPVGRLLHATATSERDLAGERVVYRLVGVDARAEQSWATYARSVLAFSAVSVLLLYALLRLQGHLLLDLGFSGVEPSQAWNTAVSFVTNTNWQSYSGESTMGHLVQMAGLAVQNFVSAAVGIAVAFALVRGLARASSATLGNFWVDLVRISLRVLLPLAFVGAIVLVACGAIQNLSAGTDVTTIAGGTQHLTGGPVASQESVKELGTNGGGFSNANSAHPYENPTSVSNWFELLLILVIPFSIPRVFGLMVGDVRQGRAVALTMGLLAIISVGLTNAFLVHPSGTIPTAVGGALGGTEARFGVAQSATFAAITTLTSTGAVNSFHDSSPTSCRTRCASPPRAPSPCITASAHGDRVEVRVTDTGPGVPEDGRDQIFLPFQRLGDHDSTTGVGLGLALSRGLVEAMAGTLTPEDTPGGGLTMTISLPAVPPITELAA